MYMQYYPKESLKLVEGAVFTKETAVKAVDAWSPVMAKYKG
jgi:hypothetical protein